MKMRILLATDLYIPAINGVVTSTVALKNSLEQMGHDVRVLTLSEHDYIDIKQDIYALSSFNVNKIYPGARVKFTKDRAVLGEIIDWQPDIIHTQSEFSTFRMAKYIAHYLSIPIVHTYHTIYEDYTHYFSPSKKTGRKVVSLLSKKLLSDAEYVIAPTDKVKRLLDTYEVTQPIKVIPTGIQLSQFNHKMGPAKRAEMRKNLGIPKDAFVLISLGRLGKEKNLEELLLFLSLLKIEVHLLVVGDGPNRFELGEYARELAIDDRVTFTGMVPPEDVALYYQLADVFVSASTSETQGLTYIEALASGLPAICRADESIENVVIDGVTGFQYHSFKEFESCLYTVRQNQVLYSEMKTQAEEFAFQNYSSEAFGEHVYEVYEKSLSSFHAKKFIYTKW